MPKPPWEFEKDDTPEPAAPPKPKPHAPKMVRVTGNTYPVKDQIKSLGGRWNPDEKAWFVPEVNAAAAQRLADTTPEEPRERGHWGPRRCVACGATASRYVRIYRSGECRDCFEERKMGY